MAPAPYPTTRRQAFFVNASARHPVFSPPRFSLIFLATPGSIGQEKIPPAAQDVMESCLFERRTLPR